MVLFKNEEGQVVKAVAFEIVTREDLVSAVDHAGRKFTEAQEELNAFDELIAAETPETLPEAPAEVAAPVDAPAEPETVTPPEAPAENLTEVPADAPAAPEEVVAPVPPITVQ